MMATHNSEGPWLCPGPSTGGPGMQGRSDGGECRRLRGLCDGCSAHSRGSHHPLSIRRSRSGWLLATALLAGLIHSLATESVVAPSGAQFTLSAYANARDKFNRDTNNVDVAWQFARSCFDWAEYAKNDNERERIAREGIAASRQSIMLNPRLGAGHYYLAFNLGQLARTKLLGALSIVKEMERELKTARDLDEHFNFGGPDRTLGQLYFEAPGWPTSIGDKVKARRHFQRAVELNGRYPDNRLLLMEAWLDARERANVRREAGSFATLLPDLRREFAGETWEASWTDWDRRWKAIEGKVRRLK